MGVLLEPGTSDWDPPPKKKWIRHYMLAGEEPRDFPSFTASVNQNNDLPTNIPSPLEKKYLPSSSVSSPSQVEGSRSPYQDLVQGSRSPYEDSKPLFLDSNPGCQEPEQYVESNPSNQTTFPKSLSHVSSTLDYRSDGLSGSPSSRFESFHQPAKGFILRSEDIQEVKRRTGAGTREVHNKLEKNRRAHLKECFDVLKSQVPNLNDKKSSNLSILRSTLRYIQCLKRKEREYEHEMERLAREKIASQQHLVSLKRELSAQWDHIDFSTILPDMHSFEVDREKETNSTSTASEQGDEMDAEDTQGQRMQQPQKLTKSPKSTQNMSKSAKSAHNVSKSSSRVQNVSQSSAHVQNVSVPTSYVPSTVLSNTMSHPLTSDIQRPMSATLGLSSRSPVHFCKGLPGKLGDVSNMDISIKPVVTSARTINLTSTPPRSEPDSWMSPQNGNIGAGTFIPKEGTVQSPIPSSSPSTTVQRVVTTHSPSVQINAVADHVKTRPLERIDKQTEVAGNPHSPHNSRSAKRTEVHKTETRKLANMLTVEKQQTDAMKLKNTVSVGQQQTDAVKLVNRATVEEQSEASAHPLPVTSRSGICSFPAHMQIQAQVLAHPGLQLPASTALLGPSIQVITPPGIQLLTTNQPPPGHQPLALTVQNSCSGTVSLTHTNNLPNNGGSSRSHTSSPLLATTVQATTKSSTTNSKSVPKFPNLNPKLTVVGELPLANHLYVPGLPVGKKHGESVALPGLPTVKMGKQTSTVASNCNEVMKTSGHEVKTGGGKMPVNLSTTTLTRTTVVPNKTRMPPTLAVGTTGLTIPNGVITHSAMSLTAGGKPESLLHQGLPVSTGKQISSLLQPRVPVTAGTIGITHMMAPVAAAGHASLSTIVSGSTLTPIVAPVQVMSQGNQLAHILANPQLGKVVTQPMLKPIPIVGAQYLNSAAVGNLSTQQLVKPVVMVTTPSTAPSSTTITTSTTTGPKSGSH